MRAFLPLLLLIILCKPGFTARFDALREEGFVIVSADGPDDGGDFGPKTPGTTTAGIGEALQYLEKANTDQHRSLNLYIASGHYSTSSTIHIPWLGERLQIDAREAWIDYTPTHGDALVIDSQMNGRLRFGYISGMQLTDGWIVKVKPVHPGPSAPLPKERQSSVIVSTLIEFNAIVAKEYFKDGVAQRGNGILLDASVGPILWSTVDISEINTCGVGAQLTGNCHYNTIDLWFNHGCNTHLQIDQGVSQNRIYSAINSEKVPESIGALIAGERNTLSLAMTQVAKGKSVIFEKPAQFNVVQLNDSRYGFTNNAPLGANRIVANDELSIKTPQVPQSETALINPVPAVVEVLILDPGDVRGWSLQAPGETEQKISAGLHAGQQIQLRSGESISLRYRKRPPKWHWRTSP
ncbi:MAG: hypothetical protein MK161_06635 [Pirellulales bacterium]|nr:hypothetical protein [Pirellulales bacterium]